MTLLRNLQGSSRYRARFEERGVPAILATNEGASQGFPDGVRQLYRPYGYIYGSGCGNIITMVEAFPSSPKGLIMVDIDPAVVYFGKMLVNSLKRNSTRERFARGFLYPNRGHFLTLEEEVLDLETDPTLKAHFKDHRGRLEHWFSFATLHESVLPEPDFDKEYRVKAFVEDSLTKDPYGRRIDTTTILARNYDTLHQLASNGNIAVIHADMFDPELLRHVAELPTFGQSNNVVYVSNVPDHIVRAVYLGESQWYNRPDEFLEMINNQMGRLRVLDPQSPHRNVFIDTTQKSLNYQLRAQPTSPQYTRTDLDI